MKRFAVAALFLALVLLAGCSQPEVLRYLPDPVSGGMHSCEDWQDSTDYGEYHFVDVTAWQLQFTGHFEIVTTEDLERLVPYVEEFEQWVALCEDCPCDVAESYRFSVDLLEAGDYFGLECAEPRGDFLGDFTLSYFDMDTQTLYILRCNI